MAALVLFALSGVSKADSVGGIDFGLAGPSNWGVLELGGSGASGFGTSGAQVSMSNSNAGVFGTAADANIGIADGGKANFSAGTIQGTLDEAPTHASNSISGTTIVGGINATYDFSTVAADAASGLASALGLSCNMGGLCNTALSPGSDLTITPVNPGGQNVLVVSSINLNGVYVTLGGPANTNWVIIDTGDLSTSGGGGAYPNGEGILLGSSLTPLNNLLVVQGKVATSGGGNTTGGGSTEINGVLVVPTGTASFSPGRVNGEVIGGDDMSFVSGAQVSVPLRQVPEPSSLLLLGTGLLGLVGTFKRKLFS